MFSLIVKTIDIREIIEKIRFKIFIFSSSTWHKTYRETKFIEKHEKKVD